MPLVLAVLLSYCLLPVVDLAERRVGLPHGVAVMTALVVAASSLLALVAVVTVAAHDIVGKAKLYESYVLALSSRAAAAHKSATASLANSKLGSKFNVAATGDFLADSLSEFSLGAAAVNVTQRLLASFAQWASNALLVIVFVIYLLEGQRKARARPRSSLVSRIQGRIQRYMSIKLALSLANGMLAWLTYRALRLDLALAFGFIHFVLNFSARAPPRVPPFAPRLMLSFPVPSVGPLIATLIPLPVVLVDPKLRALEVVLTIALPTVSHIAIGHYLEPKLMGDSLELHPITVLLCLIFWGMIWGIPGMLLAAPMTAAAKLVFESMAVTLPLAQLLAGVIDHEGEATTPRESVSGREDGHRGSPPRRDEDIGTQLASIHIGAEPADKLAAQLRSKGVSLKDAP